MLVKPNQVTSTHFHRFRTEDITPYSRLCHSFRAGGGTCIAGEISWVNDDSADNRFLGSGVRYPLILKDVAATRVLYNDYGAPR